MKAEVILIVILPIAFVCVLIGMLFFYYLFKFKYFILKLNEIKDFEFDLRKLQKAEKIANYDLSFKKDLNKWKKIQESKNEVCDGYFDNIYEAKKCFKQFNFIKGIKQHFKIKNNFYKFSKNFWNSVNNINELFIHEDFVRIFLYDLQNIYSELKNEYEKNSENLKIVSEELKKKFLFLNNLFFQGFTNIEQGKYKNLKNILIEISQRLEILCNLIPTLNIGIFVYKKWFDETFNEVINKSKQYKEKNQFNSEVRKLNFYKNKIYNAIKELNFHEIEILVNDFYSLANEINEWVEWNIMSKNIYEKSLEKINYFYLKIANHYEYLIYFYDTHRHDLIKSLELDKKIYKISNDFNEITLLHKEINKPIPNSKSDHMLYLNRKRKSEKLLRKINIFLTLLEKTDNLIHNYIFIKTTLQHEIYVLKKYLIRIINLQLEIDSTDLKTIIDDIIAWKIILNDASKFCSKYNYFELLDLKKQIEKTKKQIYNYYFKLTIKSNEIKLLENNLLIWNNRFKDFYVSDDDRNKIMNAILLFNEKKYNSCEELLKKLIK